MESGTQSNVGSPEWLATIRNNLIAGLVRLQTPPPSPAPLEAAAHYSIRHLVEIEKELKKGAAASPLIAANAGRLRKLYQDRLIGLGHLDDALRQRTADDVLYARLAALDTPAAAPAATAVPPATMPVPAAPVGVAARRSEHSRDHSLTRTSRSLGAGAQGPRRHSDRDGEGG